MKTTKLLEVQVRSIMEGMGWNIDDFNMTEVMRFVNEIEKAHDACACVDRPRTNTPRVMN